MPPPARTQRSLFYGFFDIFPPSKSERAGTGDANWVTFCVFLIYHFLLCSSLDKTWSQVYAFPSPLPALAFIFVAQGGLSVPAARRFSSTFDSRMYKLPTLALASDILYV